MSNDFVEALRSAYCAGSPPAEPLMQGFPAPAEQRVTWHNFMTSPHNRWAFQHMERIRPGIVVERGSQPVRPLPAATQGLEEFSFESASGDTLSLHDHLKASHTDGWLVLKDGQVVQELYALHHQPRQRHIMFSVTKSLIGLHA